MDVNLEDIWQQYGLDGLQQGLNSMFPEYSLSLSKLLERLLTGDFLGTVEYLFDGTIGGVLRQLEGLKDILFWLLLLGIASAVMTHFVEIFDRHQIADLSYYFMYLLFMIILFRCFAQTAQIAGNALGNIVMFIQLMVPTYLLAVGVATGITTAGAYTQLFTLVVYGVERLLGSWVRDLISVYVTLSMVNAIWIEEKLELLVELIHKVISVLLKGAIGVVTGISIFQSLVTPVIDTAKNSILQKIVSAVPGIGNATEGVIELVVGSAVIIKNSIGVLLLLLLVVLCVAPIVQILAIAWILRLAAAFLGLVSDKRLVSCTNRIGEGCMLMFRTVATAMVLFVILISLLAASTNRGF